MNPKILLLDIETAPLKVYTWGLYDQNISPVQIIDNAYMLCWSAKWLDKKETMFDSIFNHKKEFYKNMKNDETVAKSIWPLLDEADIVIAHNGDNFDIKWLHTVFLKHQMKPVSSFKTIDTCKIGRAQFKFGSNKLEEMAKYLGVGQKIEHEGFGLWIKCMVGDKESWPKMEEYNKHDIFLLEGVYNKLRPYIKNHPNIALYYDDANPICSGCSGKNTLQKRGFAFTAVNKYQRYVCKDCGRWTRGRKSLLTKEKLDTIQNNCL